MFQLRGCSYFLQFKHNDFKNFCLHISATCTFEESHVCGYTQDTSDNFDWKRGSGATITPGTGPVADHSLGSASGMHEKGALGVGLNMY